MHRARTIASGLLLFTGVGHLLEYFLSPGAGALAVAVFGVIYFLLGLLLRRPGTWPLWLAVALPAVGGIGGSLQLREHFDPVFALFVAIDVAVVACCVWLLLTRRQTA
jgi:hypothetical protein